jgi:hypothetical protein
LAVKTIAGEQTTRPAISVDACRNRFAARMNEVPRVAL